MGDSKGTGPRRVAGPLFTTQRIHHWISQHPGCTRDEIKAAARELGIVDVGYARRSYADHLNRTALSNTRNRDCECSTR